MTRHENVEYVLAELKEYYFIHLIFLHHVMRYTNEIDVDFVQKAIMIIGKLAVKYEVYLSNCIAIINDLNKRDTTYVREATIQITQVLI